MASAVSVSCGEYHTAVVFSDGTLWTAGNNNSGQLCRNVYGGSAAATNFGQVAGVDGVAAVSCGREHTAAVLSDGTLWTAGNNHFGQSCRFIASGSERATNIGQVEGVDGVAAVSCGESHTAVVFSDGTLWTAGNNTYGQLCRTSVYGAHNILVTRPTNFGQVADVDGVVAASCGGEHTAAVLSGGTLWTAGSNLYGQLCRNLAGGSTTTILGKVRYAIFNQ
jgi:alpha-tubulin suppressor-like RCC1 family protein